MLPVVLSLACALTYGAADYFGGLASRRATMFAVVLISQSAGLIALLAVLPFLGGHAGGRDYALGAIGGVFGAGGIALLYRGLAIGRMGVVSPITAVLAALTPVLYALARGDRSTLITGFGMAGALVAVVLISRGPHSDEVGSLDWRLGLPPGVAEAVGSGIVLGGFFIALSAIDRGAGLAPLVSARLASIATIGLGAVALRQTLAAPRNVLPTILVSGVLDMTANVFFVLAARSGMLSIVAVVSSLYPAATIALAGMFLHERLTPVQWAGVGCALAGVALIAL